ncbi:MULTISPECIES: NADPH-dependent oxidoreductase [unclassified Saccharopolyspora]|uniref:NADPH-dependent oxidoreductase n=1 Tax=unclassified Saccharopolyspora TaxID=2646250 RepID=UPI001CD58333|nr:MULTISPECIES: NADPH-dependent oxidoreductase [unclassified Saccharopolyspora]MCA1185422.1 NADPH-dependent oxidoreductase [Saccharopolyspora sp. 6T]MCA1192355.1 NADPH-dependent oxidoreductase [Saccharopolyspora sp. 6V]MCA1225237.1 NADPH-dependent oxidoreductase [Saccharopolyspora sp. 6M]
MPKHDALLRARYGDQPAPATILWNQQVEALLAHRSVRAFTDEPVPEGALETIVAAAQSASTSSNLHQWSVVAISEPETKRELARLTRSARTDGGGYDFVADAPTVLLWVADMSRSHAISSAHGGDPVVTDYLDAFLMASVDAALAAQNGMVATESLGLGGVYLGSLRNHAEELAELVDLPPYAYVVFGTAIGIPDETRPSAVRPRPAQNVVLHHEKYDHADHAEWVRDYEAATTVFRTENGLRDKTWAEAVVTGTGFDYMDGRENLRPTLQRRGFGLR